MKKMKKVLGVKSLPLSLSKKLYKLEKANEINLDDSQTQLVEIGPIKSHQIKAKVKFSKNMIT